MAKLTVEEQALEVLRSRTTKRGRPKKWENFTNVEKRIAVAYDVIGAVLASVYVPKTSIYVNSRTLRRAAAATKESSVQKLLLTNQVQDCEVCGIGGCFLSLVKFDNKLNIADLPKLKLASFHTQEGSERARLVELFGEKNVGQIESAFESSNFTQGFYKEAKASIAFGEKFDDSRDRLLAIMMNIIANGGDFKPSKR